MYLTIFIHSSTNPLDVKAYTVEVHNVMGVSNGIQASGKLIKLRPEMSWGVYSEGHATVDSVVELIQILNKDV